MSERERKEAERPKAKGAWFMVGSDGQPQCMSVASNRRCGAIPYVPRDSSAEGRAARYERALRKIARMCSPGMDCYREEQRIARRALAKEKKR